MEARIEERRKGDSRLITLAIAVIAQAGTGIWWAASITTELHSNTKVVESMQQAQYTKSEARSDFRNVELQIVEVARRVSSIEERKVPR